MSDDSTALPPSIRGVVVSAVVLTLTVFASCLFAYFGWRSLEADLVPFTLMLAADGS